MLYVMYYYYVVHSMYCYICLCEEEVKCCVTRRVLVIMCLSSGMALDNGHARWSFSTNLSLLDNRCRTIAQQRATPPPRSTQAARRRPVLQLTPRYTWLVRLALSLTEDEFASASSTMLRYVPFFFFFLNFKKKDESQWLYMIFILLWLTTDVAWGALEQSIAPSLLHSTYILSFIAI